MLVRIEDVAEAALQGDALSTRALWAEFVDSVVNVADVEQPSTDDHRVVALAASLLELLAERRQELAPSWVATVAGCATPQYLMTVRTEHKRIQLRKTSPKPLASRNFFASPNYLLSA